MSFLSAPWLWALPAAVALPVLVHLLNRGRPRKIPWAATRFLAESVRKNRNRLRLKDLLLLALRALVLALLVLLAARPVFWGQGSPQALPAAPLSAMLVLDLSASMAQSDGRQSRLDLARGAALDLISGLGAGSLCGLLGATDRAVPVVPKPTRDLDRVRRELERLPGSDRGSDLLPAIERALRELRQAGGDQAKAVYVFTDNQVPAWRDRAAIEELARSHPDISIRAVPAGEKGEPNLSVSRLAIHPANPGRGETAGVRVDVTNFGAEPALAVRVALSSNRNPPENQATIERIEPGATASARMNILFREEGPQTVLAQIPPDRFPPDDRRSLAVEVGSPRRVLVVSASAGQDERRSPGFFVRKALEAISPPGAVRAATPSSVAGGIPEDVTAVFACGVSALDAAFWEALGRHVEGGGGAVVFPAADASAGALGTSSATRWLPGSLGGKSGGPASWQQDSMRHPATAPWRDPRRTLLSAIRSSLRFDLAANPGSQPLALWSDGKPVALHAPVGGGHGVLWSGPALPEATNAVFHPFFPVLMGELLAFFDGVQSRAEEMFPGEPFRKTVSAELVGKPLFLESDRGGDRIPSGEVAASGEGGAIALPPLEKPGGYRLWAGGREPALAAFAVGLDPGESELAAVPPFAVEASGPETPAREEAAPASLPREQRDLWGLFAWLLIGFFAAEFAAATVFTVSRR